MSFFTYPCIGRPTSCHSWRNFRSSIQRSSSASESEYIKSQRTWDRPNNTHVPFATRQGYNCSVVSYNVLSTHLYRMHPHLYTGSQPHDAEWTVRGPRIWTQMMSYAPQIICLQEVDAENLDSFWRPLAASKGYTVQYKKRSGPDKRDGCAILYSSEQLQSECVSLLEYNQRRHVRLDRDNVAIVMRFRIKHGHSTGNQFVVANTHLLYNPNRDDIRLRQLAQFFAEIDRLAKTSSAPSSTPSPARYLPVILCGDFNMNPYQSIYRFITEGALSESEVATICRRGGARCGHSSPDGSARRRLHSPANHRHPLLSHLLPAAISHTCQYSASIPPTELPPASQRLAPGDNGRAKRWRGCVTADSSETAVPAVAAAAEDNCATECDKHTPEGVACLSHTLALRSVCDYSRHNYATTRHDCGWINVDYILYSGDSIQLNGYLRPLTAHSCERLGPYPSSAMPSDHLPVCANFTL